MTSTPTNISAACPRLPRGAPDAPPALAMGIPDAPPAPARRARRVDLAPKSALHRRLYLQWRRYHCPPAREREQAAAAQALRPRTAAHRRTAATQGSLNRRACRPTLPLLLPLLLLLLRRRRLLPAPCARSYGQSASKPQRRDWQRQESIRLEMLHTAHERHQSAAAKRAACQFQRTSESRQQRPRPNSRRATMPLATMSDRSRPYSRRRRRLTRRLRVVRPARGARPGCSRIVQL